MARKQNNSAQYRSRPEVPTQQAAQRGTVVLTYPVFGLILALVLVCGLLAGSFLTQQQVVVHQTVPQAAPQTAPQGQDSAVAPRKQIPRETLEHIAALERQVVSEPGNREAMVHLGHLYFDTDQYQNAIKAYENALAMDRNDPDVLTDLGVMYRAIHQYEKAVACFDEARAVSPGHTQSLYNKGIVLFFDLHRHEEGIACWEELLKLDPKAQTPGGSPLADFIRDARENLSK